MQKKISRMTILSVILFVLILAWFALSVKNAGSAMDSRHTQSVYSTVMNGAVLCYSIEGEYPESLEYLKENYGVIYNGDEYIVDYKYFGANIRPTVTVAEKTEA